MDDSFDISVILTTFNRAAGLSETLDALTHLELPGSVEFVIVDNNSHDDTRKVIDSFSSKLPLRYLFEAQAGKSAALNRALDQAPLGDVVVFTDDDIVPREDWLCQILAVTSRWPEYDIFGGRIYLIWPHSEVPEWALDRSVQGWAFGLHDLSDRDQPYVEPYYPVGINYWVRREVIERRRFDVGVGPRPNKRAMGCETAFLKMLAAEGHRLMFSPDAVVGHCLQPGLLTPEGIRRKAYSYGRGGPHVWGLCRPDLLRTHPWIWRSLRLLSLVRACGRYTRARLSLAEAKRLLGSLEPLSDVAYNLEALRMVVPGAPPAQD